MVGQPRGTDSPRGAAGEVKEKLEGLSVAPRNTAI
jgi:hypothetical protein